MTTATPTQVTAGDTLAWFTDNGGFQPSAGWQLSYVFQVGATAVTVPGTPSGSGWAMRLAPEQTADWPAGAVHWQAYASNGTDRHTVGRGQITVHAAIAAGADQRSHAERTLAAIEAKLEGRGGSGIDEYQIAGRRIRYIPIPDLLRLRDRYRADVAAERAGNAAGASAGRRILTRL